MLRVYGSAVRLKSTCTCFVGDDHDDHSWWRCWWYSQWQRWWQKDWTMTKRKDERPIPRLQGSPQGSLSLTRWRGGPVQKSARAEKIQIIVCNNIISFKMKTLWCRCYKLATELWRMSGVPRDWNWMVVKMMVMTMMIKMMLLMIMMISNLAWRNMEVLTSRPGSLLIWGPFQMERVMSDLHG